MTFFSSGSTSLLATRPSDSDATLRPERPPLVQRALDNKEDVYYFGVGSNLSRKKVETRGSSPIVVKSMQPAVVPGYRLAFNMRGFPPLEPGMGSIEPLDDPSHKALLAYERQECHGALIRLSSEDYEKMMRSEGVGLTNSTVRPGYEEVVLEVTPYGATKSVQAVALRARPHCRLKQDPCPSLRYMEILREGAQELGLKPCYQEWLANHPVQQSTKLVQRMAVRNLAFTFTLSRLLKTRILSQIQSRLLFAVYLPSTAPRMLCWLSELATGLILLPGSLFGWFLLALRRMSGKTANPMMKIMLDRYG